jgi:hypothetical protein
MVYVADYSRLLRLPPPLISLFFYAHYDEYLERKLFCLSVIYDKAYISFFVSWEIPFCLQKLVYFSTLHRVGVIYVQSFGGETWGKETTEETQA